MLQHSTTDPHEMGGTSLYFDGNGDYLRMDNAFDWHDDKNKDFTIECWWKWENTNDDGYMWGFNIASTGNDTFIMRPDHLYFYDTSQGIQSTHGNNGIWYGRNDGNWHHTAVVQDSETGLTTWYVDGKVNYQWSNNLRLEIPLKDCICMLGGEADAANAGSLGNWYLGYIQDFKISNVAKYKGSNSRVEWSNFLQDGEARWTIDLWKNIYEVVYDYTNWNDGLILVGSETVNFDVKSTLPVIYESHPPLISEYNLMTIVKTRLEQNMFIDSIVRLPLSDSNIANSLRDLTSPTSIFRDYHGEYTSSGLGNYYGDISSINSILSENLASRVSANYTYSGAPLYAFDTIAII